MPAQRPRGKQSLEEKASYSKNSSTRHEITAMFDRLAPLVAAGTISAPASR